MNDHSASAASPFSALFFAGITLTGLMTSVLLSGCAPGSGESTAGDTPEAQDTEEAEGEAQSEVLCAEVSGTDSHRSLAVTDPEVLANFSFKRTMTKIRATAGIAASQSALDVYQSWMGGFTSCGDPRVDPNGYGLDCDRFMEAHLGTVNPFAADSTVKFIPVGLFNRLDLAPSNGAHCGEYRIVYAMQSTDSAIAGRAFIIFEAALPNPQPASGQDACLPVARFWQSLSTDNDVNSRAAKLEKFYFTGGAVDGFAPVVKAAHYGLATNAEPATAGQIRTNFFVDVSFMTNQDQEWNLREHKLHRTCTDPADAATCTLAVQQVTVKANPANELFAGTHSRSSAFRTQLVSQVANLDAVTLSGIKMSMPDQFNEWESVSQTSPILHTLNVDYTAFADSTIRGQIAAKIASVGAPLTVDDILERATTQTCAGCHQASNNQSLGGGLAWPSSLGFVHIDEESNLSPALTGTFLPRRKVVLERFINTRCSGTPAAAVEGITLGDSVEGAAN